MKISSSNRAAIAARLRNMRKAGALALVSLSTLRALSAVEDRAMGRLVRSIVTAGKTDDNTRDEETLGVASSLELSAETAPQSTFSGNGYTLTLADRANLAAAMGRLPRSNVFRNAPLAAPDDPADLLPANYVPATIAPYSPILAHDPAIDAQAAREAAAELAAQDLLDDEMFVGPIDYSPGFTVTAPVKVAAVKAQPTPAIRHPNRAAHKAWQAAILRSINTAR